MYLPANAQCKSDTTGNSKRLQSVKWATVSSLILAETIDQGAESWTGHK